MTTAIELAGRKLVRAASFRLKAGEVRWRDLFLTPQVEEWFAALYRDDPPTTWDADLTPKEQAYSIVKRFVVGDNLISKLIFTCLYREKMRFGN